MNCEHARDWLLQSEDPRPQACVSAEVADHLAGCESCRAFAAQLTSLEQAWRDQPVPALAESSRVAFLHRLPTGAPSPAKRQAAGGLVRWATAALLLFVVSAVVWTLAPTPTAHASSPLIEQLVDWNLSLAQTPDQAERARLYADKEANLKRASQSAKLTPEEQELVGLLLETGSKLAGDTDPVDAAEQLSNVADKLVERLAVAAKGQDRPAMDRYAKLQGKVSERGVSAQLARAEEQGVLNFEKERRIEKLVLRDSKRMNTLVDLLETNPDLSRKDIRQALNIPAKAAKTSSGLAFDLEVPSSPVPAGQPINCTVRLHNPGAVLHKLLLVVTLPEDAEVLSVSGPTGHRQDGSQVIFRQLATLPRGGDATFEIHLKTARSGALKCRAELRGKQLGDRPVWREQSITVNNAL